MAFKRFWQISALYLLLVIILTAAGVYVLFNTYFWLSSVWIFSIELFIIYSFLRFIRREHSKLSHFLISISQEDFTPPYSKAYKDFDLNSAFNQLSDVIKTLRDDAETNYQYLQTIINQIDAALVCIDHSDRVALSNDSALHLFKKSVLRNLNSLSTLHGNLPSILKELRPGERRLVKLNVNGDLLNYSIQLAKFKLSNESYRLYAFQNVQNELEQAELESWQKLTRVMAHEITNSAIPISNLSGIVYSMLFDSNGMFFNTISDDKKEDIKDSLKTVESRSKGLVNFVGATKNFTKMPKPEFEILPVKALIERVVALMKPRLNKLGIDLKIEFPVVDLSILADQSLIEQVLLNLMLNAMEALNKKDKPIIEIRVYENSPDHAIISVSDNGEGIPDVIIDNIFIPFFTTKPEGSGIGLSLVKQIMFIHKGTVSVKSKPNEGTSILLSF